MTAEQLFSILNLMTMAAWLPLVFLPRVRWTVRTSRGAWFMANNSTVNAGLKTGVGG